MASYAAESPGQIHCSVVLLALETTNLTTQIGKKPTPRWWKYTTHFLDESLGRQSCSGGYGINRVGVPQNKSVVFGSVDSPQMTLMTLKLFLLWILDPLIFFPEFLLGIQLPSYSRSTCSR